MIKEFIYCFILIILFSTCIDPFDPGIDGKARKLVVDGLITNLPDPYNVRLTYSEPYNNDSLTLPITNAKVHIIDDLGNRFDLQHTSQGNYVTDTAQFQGEIGRTYTLYIQTSDGKNYQSQSEKMLPAPKIDTVFTRFIEKPDSRGVVDKYFEVYARTTDPLEQENFYQWRWTHYDLLEYCEEIYDIRIRSYLLYKCCNSGSCWAITRCRGLECIQAESDLYFNGNQFEFYLTKIPFDSKEDYFLQVDQLALSETTYRFWKTANEQLNNTGGIFDVPPSAAVGNIFNINDPDEQVLGIFNVAGATRKGTYLKRIYANGLPNPKEYAFPRIEQRDCQSCMESTRKTAKKPKDW